MESRGEKSAQLSATYQKQKGLTAICEDLTKSYIIEIKVFSWFCGGGGHKKRGG